MPFNPIRDGSKFTGYPGRDNRQGGEDFFRKHLRGRRLYLLHDLKIQDFKAIFKAVLRRKRGATSFFSKKIGGRRVFPTKKGGEDF